MKITAILLFAISMTSMFACSKDKPTNSPGSNSIKDVIYPLAIGNTWTRRITEFDTTGVLDSSYSATDSILGVINRNEENYYVLQHDSHGDYCAYNTLNGYHTVYIEPDTMLSSNLKWEYPGNVGDSWIDFDSQITIDSVSARVTVPAGTFICYKYQSVGSYFIDYVYFCPRIGPVKEETFGGGILFGKEELISYHISPNSE